MAWARGDGNEGVAAKTPDLRPKAGDCENADCWGTWSVLGVVVGLMGVGGVCETGGVEEQDGWGLAELRDSVGDVSLSRSSSR